MSAKKIETALNLIEIAETNLKTAKALLLQAGQEKGGVRLTTDTRTTSSIKNTEESGALEVVEGHFDGENMIGDNGKTYLVPQNYASKTQLVVGDRMKWILTPEREIFKLIQPVNRERVTGTFAIEGDNFVVLVDKFANSIKVLKASATYAMKQLGLQPGDEVAIYVPREGTATWGAFINVVKSGGSDAKVEDKFDSISSVPAELDALNEFQIDDKNRPDGGEKDYF